MAKKLQSLSIFFPAFNEVGNIIACIRAAEKIAKKVAHNYEIIIINDGSTDKTAQKVRQLKKDIPQLSLYTQKNQGYAGALKAGFAVCKNEWIFFSDSDNQFDLNELKSFIRYTETYRVIIGYRKKRAEGWKRQIFALALKVWNRIFLGFPSEIKDIDCAFKLLHTSAVKEISPLVAESALISTELLLKLHHSKIMIKQVPVTHYKRMFGVQTGNNRAVIYKAIVDTLNLKIKLLSKNQVTNKVGALS